jgi:hypothetical protein
MFWSFEMLAVIYRQLYKDTKKKFEKSGKLAPYALLFTSKMHIEPGQKNLDFGEFTVPVEVITSQYGSSLEVPINNEDDESKFRSFEAIQVLAESVEADCMLTVGEVWVKTVNIDLTDPKVEEAIQFSFQTKDGAYQAQIPIMRKGKKVKLPSAPPPLEPTEVLGGTSKVF